MVRAIGISLRANIHQGRPRATEYRAYASTSSPNFLSHLPTYCFHQVLCFRNSPSTQRTSWIRFMISASSINNTYNIPPEKPVPMVIERQSCSRRTCYRFSRTPTAPDNRRGLVDLSSSTTKDQPLLRPQSTASLSPIRNRFEGNRHGKRS